jgi:hypothetical protein
VIRVEDELDEGEVVWDVGERVAWRDKFSHGGGRERGKVMTRPRRNRTKLTV